MIQRVLTFLLRVFVPAADRERTAWRSDMEHQLTVSRQNFIEAEMLRSRRGGSLHDKPRLG